MESGHANFLLDCLQEVGLEQFAGNFATRGITNSARLAALDRRQFAIYGITSPADVRRLSTLIAVLRSLPADGDVYRRSGESQVAAEKPDSSYNRRTLSVPGDLWQTSRPTSIDRSQQKQFADRRAIGDVTSIGSSSLDITDTRSKTAASRRRQRPPRRGARRAATTAEGNQWQHSLGCETQYDGPTSFIPLFQRTVSDLPTHVEKVR